MAKKVGIPRGLFYFKYYPLWKSFFEELGAEVVVSGHTTKKVLDDGVKHCIDEACLPVKLYFGHVMDLKDRVDYLFVPRFTSISKGEYICPKFGGLPDMVRHGIKGLPQIIDTEINLRRTKRDDVKSVLKIGSYFCSSSKEIKDAYKNALNDYYNFKKMIKDGILPSDILEKKLAGLDKNDKNTLNIAVIGHVYNLYDRYINMNMIQKLKSNNTRVITIDMLDDYEINEKSKRLDKKMFWHFGRKAIGSALHILDRDDIDGIIYVMSFGCGVDSFISDLVERKIKRGSSIPFMTLTIDEHSGEAGLNTRLEAFVDMIERRRGRNVSNLSSYG